MTTRRRTPPAAQAHDEAQIVEEGGASGLVHLGHTWGMMLRTPLACSSASSRLRDSCSPCARLGSCGPQPPR